MTSQIFDFNADILPEIIYMDTSYIRELYGQITNPVRQGQCDAFHRRMQVEQIIMIITSLVLEELRHIILRGIYRPYAAAQRMDWRQLLRTDKSYVPTAIAEIRRIEALLNADPLIIILNADLTYSVNDDALQIMEAYGVDSADAYHIALARQNEINSFVTLDQDFGQIGNINIFTCDAVLLRNQTTAATLLPFSSPTI
ncbi:type II toxin-antitoxin system VapC family toxin [bacterium]|nr:type II toxin-antitoxin system VapC family toxin [bacterium]